MGLTKTFATDRKAENDGVSLPMGINDHNKQPIEFVVSRMSKTNTTYAKALEEATRPHMAAIQNETMDNELGDNMLREVFVDGVLRGWKNVSKSELTDNEKDAEDLPYTRENALALFDKLPDLYASLVESAKKAATFREAQRAKSAKN